ncbi:MAG: adenylate kinase [Candidatus Saccharicenans sp.]|nr:adenylate kinase [Candidatus Saccharicenans sp.]
MRIILLGPAGSGKGTQGEMIERHYGFPRISTGDLLRLEVEKDTALGKIVKKIMEAGELVADDIVLEIVRSRIAQPDCKRGYVLDGFPRTLNQAILLEKVDGSRPEIAIEIQVSEEALKQRLAGRLVCLQCGTVYNINNNKLSQCQACGARLTVRNDDRPEVVSQRFRIYRETIGPLIEYYSKKGVLFRIDGEKTPEEVFREVKSVIDSRLN